MKILKLEAANIKRLKAIEIIPAEDMVVLAGKNRQGKTSILDAIWWALGGSKNIQAKPIRDGEKSAVVRLALGDKEPELLVERRFTEKGDYLYVRNPEGMKAGDPQGILNKLVGHLTFDPVAFMREKPADQEKTLRRLVPLLDDKGEPLNEQVLDAQRAAAFTDRTGHNRDHAQAKARAEAITVPADLPAEAPSVEALVQELTEIGTFNTALETEKASRAALVLGIENEVRYIDNVAAEIADWEERIADARARIASAKARHDTTVAHLEGLPELAQPKDPAEVQARIDAARAIESKIALRTQKAELEAEATGYKEQAEACTKRLEAIDGIKAAAVARAKMPVAGLAFTDGGVLFNGLPLDQASDAEQLTVSMAIAAAMNPKLRIMRVRDGSILDSDAMAILAKFCAENDYQVWIEVVDESGEVGVVIEDGGVRGQELTPEAVLAKGKGAEPETEAAASAPPVDDETTAAAKGWLNERIADLAAIPKDAIDGAQRVAALHGQVKAKLKRLPNLIETVWNPAKLEKERSLQPKKAKE